ncbi:hypothetical protein J3L16_04350 [Alteromonas sp. 5E99-2]|uniref:CsiV family protein n=1 Tax=Alteromonas sp. 5E99-2 TaxID=2817683 RepID=UPI001A986CBB|nr:hypothetical protein [Alteromonas sp. 5E99-2]
MKIKHPIKSCLLLSSLTLPCITFAQEEKQWWFDVEVIVFDRNQLIQSHQEQFEYASTLNAPKADLDLITHTNEPDISGLYHSLKPCHEEKPESLLPPIVLTELIGDLHLPEQLLPEQLLPEPLSPESQITSEEDTPPETPSVDDWVDSFLNEQFQSPQIEINIPKFGCVDDSVEYDTSAFAKPNLLPVNHFGVSHDESWGPGLLSKQDLMLQELSLRIRSEKGLTRLLHVAWRQEVKFGQENAQSVRVFGGKNYAQDYDRQGFKYIEDNTEESTEQLYGPAFDYTVALQDGYGNDPIDITAFEKRLGSEIALEEAIQIDTQTQLSELWQVDGNLKVYLQYVNRVPYLHIDGDIAYRQPITLELNGEQQEQLVSIPYKQLRRVISSQLHYFDHPMFGVLVEIRRYEKA